MKVEMSNSIAELEALVSEREGMLVLNREREAANLAYAYNEAAFVELAGRFRALKTAEPQPASTNTHIVQALREIANDIESEADLANERKEHASAVEMQKWARQLRNV